MYPPYHPNSNSNSENNKLITILDNHWQDKFTSIFFSKVGLAISNISILITMMYFSYKAHPANPTDINNCDWDSVEGLKFCKNSYPGLKDSQTGAIEQRLATIALVGIPAALYMSLHFSKYLSIVVRAQGSTTVAGMFSTTVGIAIFTGFILRATYCFGEINDKTPKWAVCAASVNDSYRVLNNTLIQLGFMVAFTGILVFISDFFIYKSVKQLWKDRFYKIKSMIHPIAIGRVVKNYDLEAPIMGNLRCENNN